TQYVLDLAATLPVVISDTDAVYLYGLDIIAEQLAQSDRYYYVHDGLGSVRQLLDNTGQIGESYAYDPFGVPLGSDTVPNPYGFTGEAWDAGVGLLYLRARYYQPETGRFITKDPWRGDVRGPGTLNRYVYVQNNAINYTDQSGLREWAGEGPPPLCPECQELMHPIVFTWPAGPEEEIPEFEEWVKEWPDPWQFTGEAWNAGVELLYLRARYYQPGTGRFVGRDRWTGDRQSPGTLNRYVYVTNNPVNLVDPAGLNGEEPLDFLLWDPPPVVTWIRDEMVQNAQSDVLRSISDLNRRSKSLRGQPAGRMKQAALLNFGWMVRQGGPWDPKPYIAENIPYYNYHRIAGDFYYYDVWGNIMFGYLGTAAGFSESELLEGAGLEQIGSDTWYAIYYRDPCRLPRPRHGWSRALRLWTWDHPEDRVTARIGMRLWSLYQTGVQTYHIIQAVVEAGDRQEISRHKLPVFIYDRRYRKSYQHEPWYKELEEEYWRGFRF
ncbi:MAG: RHS repeat-associated core domain-containing protein, partial [Anaerolineae bacterium]